LEDKVHNMLYELNSSTATVLDQLSPRFVKYGAKIIRSLLTHVWALLIKFTLLFLIRFKSVFDN